MMFQLVKNSSPNALLQHLCLPNFVLKVAGKKRGDGMTSDSQVMTEKELQLEIR